MDFGYAFEIFKRTLTNEYARFDNRVSRRDFWHYIAFYMIAYIGMVILASIVPFLFLFISLFILAIILPTIGMEVRRMHDIGKSGWWILVPLYNLYLFCQPGVKGSNQYGDNPLGGTADVFS